MKERGRRTDEVLDAVKLLLTGENVSFKGQFWQFEDVTIVPGPRSTSRCGWPGALASPTPSRRTSLTW